MRTLIISFVSLFTISVQASSLDQISAFTESICDKISTKGAISSSDLKAEIEGNINPLILSKMLGAKVKANGSYSYKGKEYEGLPYESLPSQMESARECRKELAAMLLEERRELHKGEPTVPRYVIQDSGFPNTLMKEPNFKAYISFMKKHPLQIKQLMNGARVELLDEFIEEGKPSDIRWYKVKITSGPDKGLEGWVTYKSVKSV